MASLLLFGNKKYSTIKDCTPSKEEDTPLVLPSSFSSSLRSRMYHYSTIAVVMVVLLATITVTAFSRTGSSSNITSSLFSSFQMWFGNDNSKPLRRVTDLPRCTGVDPVISADVTSAIIPLELLRKYTGTSPTTPPYVVSFEDKDQGGMVDVVTDPPTPCEESTIFSNSALWCNTKGQQIIRAQTHGMCLQDSDPEYYYIKFVSTNYGATTGVCTLLRVSRNAPGTWTEYQTESMPTTGGAIEWVYDDEDVGKRFKYSLCPDTVDDKNIVKVVVTTFG